MEWLVTSFNMSGEQYYTAHKSEAKAREDCKARLIGQHSTIQLWTLAFNVEPEPAFLEPRLTR